MPDGPSIMMTDPATERLICALAIAYPESFPIASTILQDGDITDPQYAAIIEAAKYCSSNGGLDSRSIIHRLTNTGLINSTVDGADLQSRLLSITEEAAITSPGMMEHHCRHLRELGQRRSLRVASEKIARVAQVPNASSEEVFEQALKILDEHNKVCEYSWPVELQKSADTIIEDALTKPERKFWGYQTGFADGAFDDLTGGIHRKQFWVLAGLPSMGKSTLIATLLRGFRDKNPDAGSPLLASTEMDVEAVAKFAIAGAAGVHTMGLDRRNLGLLQKEAVKKVRDRKILDGIFVQYCGGTHIDQLYNMARLFKEKNGLPLLVVDVAAGLMSNGNSEFERVTYIVRRLQAMAVRLDTCIIATAHLNRSLKEDKDNKYKPRMWHLRQTGEWEQCADRILFIHRPAYYGFDDPRTEIIQAKDRHHGNQSSIFVEYKRATGQYHKEQPPVDNNWPDQGS